jgi:hypothetical protein
MKHDYFLTKEQLKLLPKNKGGNLEKAFRYAQLMLKGVEFPPVYIHFNKTLNRWDFNDGRHRVLAAKMTGIQLKVRSSKRMGV